ncbi:hypothetical protein AB0M38_35760 [Streptomyces sp. NPDC051742]|uniref:hypothetical protein n=1 Tax=Streptomyces sp. NPDC051742 TaxID=3155169 RepID=UPI0034251F34
MRSTAPGAVVVHLGRTPSGYVRQAGVSALVESPGAGEAPRVAEAELLGASVVGGLVVTGGVVAGGVVDGDGEVVVVGGFGEAVVGAGRVVVGRGPLVVVGAVVGSVVPVGDVVAVGVCHGDDEPRVAGLVAVDGT